MLADASALLSALEDCLARYPEESSALSDKDLTRYTTIPETIRATDRGSNGCITSEELVQLVEWKLKHGKFRPSLLKLAKENDDNKVRNTTTAAFAHLASAQRNKPGEDLPWKGVELAMSDVVELRGVGPATASLVLSCYDPNSVPFFSDELFRLFHWEEQPAKGIEKGWERKITYTLKEYRSLIEKMSEFRAAVKADRRAWTCVELEKAAWVLGKDAHDVNQLLAEGCNEDMATTQNQKEPRPSGSRKTVKAHQPKKRKGHSDGDFQTQPARKSARSSRPR